MSNKRDATFRFMPFSAKQKKILTWWIPDEYDSNGNITKKGSPYHTFDAVIADGAVRSGKTSIMSLAYTIWAMSTYSGQNFGMAGKTIGSFKRNVWFWLKIMLIGRGYTVRKLSEMGDNVFAISKGEVENYFYLFGGKDERSQDLIQGFTAAGFLFDEVTLMPQSFVEQGVARCSVEGAKLWFNCNPSGPFHWFKLEWIDQLDTKRALHLHFLLEDNPSLSQAVIDKYKRMFRGIFYERFILGLWVMAEGIIYSMFDVSMVIKQLPHGTRILKKWIGVDYGQSNATTFLLVGLGSDNIVYILDEYYHEGRTSQIQKSPRKYAKDFRKWILEVVHKRWGQQHIEHIFIDPSAKGFMLQLHEEGVVGIRQADNEVIRGIELISSMLDAGCVRVIGPHCPHILKEFSAYRWNPKAQEKGEDVPIKQHDHVLDALRYICNGNRLLFQSLVLNKIERRSA